MQNETIQSDEETTPLQRDILCTLAYFDIFDHPLRISEIYRFLPSNSVTETDIQRACATEPLKSRLSNVDDLFFLTDTSEQIVADRRTKERRARRLWKAAVFMSHIIRRFPFVRAVFVSGELSKGVASKHSDIDFFIVTAENRVWICRTLFAIFKKIFLFNRKKFFCYNLIASERHLRIQDRNIFTAVEVVTVKPLFNEDLYGRFIRANFWTHQYLPNSTNSPHPLRRTNPVRFLAERMLTAVVSSDELDALDRWLLEKWKSIWQKRYHELSPGELAHRFQCRRNISTAYVGDFLHKVMDRYCQRLDRYGIVHAAVSWSE
jgi:hypothetical protein